MSGDLVAAVLLAVGAWMTVGAGGADRADRFRTRMPGLLVAAVGLAALGTIGIPGLASPLTLLGCLVLGAVGARRSGCALSGPTPATARSALGAPWLGPSVARAPARRPGRRARERALLAGTRPDAGEHQDGHDLGFTFGGAGVLALAALRSAHRPAVGSLGSARRSAFALWFNWCHWVDLSHHWTQRDLFWRYYAQRKPGEPIAAFMMNWRGETFYWKNTVKQIKDNPACMPPTPTCPAGSGRWSSTTASGCSSSAVGPGQARRRRSTGT